MKEQEGAPNVPFMEVPPDFYQPKEIEKNMTNNAKNDETAQADLGKFNISRISN